MAYTAIDIGGAAIDRATYRGGDNYTYIELTNPANASGVLTSFECWFANGTSATEHAYVGTLSGSDSSWTRRDYEDLGTVVWGSKQTYTGKNCDVQTNDIIGHYGINIYWEHDTTGGSGDGHDYPTTGNKLVDGGTQTYNIYSNRVSSCYATGVTIPDAPTNVAATDNLYDKVTVTWAAGTGETGGHRVYRDTIDISGVVAHGTATYDDTTAVPGTTYSYTVKAINDAGLSAASTADNGTRLAAITGLITEGEMSSDTFGRKIVSLTKSIAEGEKSGDTFTRYAEIIRNLLEGVKTGDAFDATVLGIIAGSIIDGAVAGDSFSEIWAGTAHLTEGVKGGDTFAASVYEVDTSFISEGFRLGDAITATSPLYVVIGEGARASDFFATVMDYIGKRTEGAKFGDNFRWIPIIFQALEVVEIESMVTLNTEFQSLVTKTKTLDSVITRTVRLNSSLDMSITMSRS